MSDLIETIPLAAERFRKSARLDYSIDSLLAIDKYFDAHLSKFAPADKSNVIAKEIQSELMAIGAYLGETLKENMLGSNWELDNDHPDEIIHVMLRLPDNTLVWPFQKTIKRFLNGFEDSLHGYAYLVTESYYEKKKNK